MREGSLEAPVRHPLDWKSEEFYDEQKLEEEMLRVFDICHGCRRCFNLCDSFPRLFDLVDESETGELDNVDSKDFKQVVDACTLCDLCFMTKCPYVPPHDFNLDFPHLMLRYRAVGHKKGKTPFVDQQLTETDRNGKLAGKVAGLANAASSNGMVRSVMEKTAGIHKDAVLPKFTGRTLVGRAQSDGLTANREAPAFGRKAVLYATCFGNYNKPEIGEAARKVLALNGVETEVIYPACCGMPKLEHGDLERVASRSQKVKMGLLPWVEKGYDVIALVPSCTLMLKFEWPLLLPDDAGLKTLAAASYDISEYIVDIARREGLAPGLQPLDGGATVHIACHARAQNMGRKAAEMLRLLPETDITVIERCSGHGGSWGIKKEWFDIALKVGKPVARKAAEAKSPNVASECPLAADHILQGIDKLDLEEARSVPFVACSPIELMARAWGL